MAKEVLPVSDDLLDTTQTITYNGEVYTRCYKDKLDAFACKYPMSVPKTSKRYAKYSDVDLTIAIKEGAKWQKKHSWKPSNEQIEALDFAADCIVPAEFCFKRKELKGLLEQLKKLKEE